MCGITGQVSARHKADLQTLLNMTSVLVHRGPDDSGTWINNDYTVGLGHRRLSVVDLSAAGHQPMVCGHERYVIVFNGEIYNHRDLRQLLHRENALPEHGWRGHSDTEILLACVNAWGLEKTLQNLVGMFAFALWDKRDKCLMLARDRVGEKPLYYGWQDGTFLFGSELKALKANPAFRSEIDWAVANTFLRCNYIPSPSSIYQNIYKLSSGSVLKLTWEDIEKNVLPEPQAYWSLGNAAIDGQNKPFRGSFSDAVDELEVLIKQAVDMQSIADVPVGAFLSGGIDSSTVAAMMQSGRASQVTTFSIGMPDATMDESRHAAAVASHLGTRHVEHIIQPHEAIDIIPNLTKVWDEPFGDSSQIPTYLVSKLARENATVALTGDGGDEFFMGYPHYALYKKLWRTRWFRHLPWERMLSLISSVNSSQKLDRQLKRAQTLVDAWDQPDGQSLNYFWRDQYRQEAVPIFEQTGVGMKSLPLMPDVAISAALSDAATYLQDDVLVKVDRAAMAHSLETRAPLLDHRILEFAYKLPVDFKLGSGGIGKSVLREVLYRHVPKDIVDRPKMGFSIPLSSWLREDLRPWVESLLQTAGKHNEIFDVSMINKMWQQHLRGEKVNTEQLWGVLSLLSFMEMKN